MVPVFAARHIEAAVSPERALEAVRDAFVAYARGEWSMPPKVYVPAYPAGDFRAMPALGGGHASLKWVTSFPGNPEQGLPTVMGLVLLSDASNGTLRAVLDAGAVTALRTGAAASLAAETLASNKGAVVAVIGTGVNGRAAIRSYNECFGNDICVYDVDRELAKKAVKELDVAGWAAKSLKEALECEILVTVTPGHEILLAEGSLRPGQHVSLMGADGPGKAEIAVDELLRTKIFCDDWEQASHNGELAHAVERGLTRDDVTQLGDVLAGTASGRQSKNDITIFDSTGLAIQDLAIALAALEKVDELELQTLDV